MITVGDLAVAQTYVPSLNAYLCVTFAGLTAIKAEDRSSYCREAHGQLTDSNKT
jgi:hypothetical protein